MTEPTDTSERPQEDGAHSVCASPKLSGDWRTDLHVHAFLSLTVADRIIERRELVWVKRFFLGANIGSNPGTPQRRAYDQFSELIEHTCDDAFNADSLATLTATAAERMADGEKRKFVNNLAQMCKSKGSINEDEYESILNIAEQIGVDDTDADSIINSVFSINDTFVAILGLLALGFSLYAMRVVLVPLVIAVFVAMIVRRFDARIAVWLGLKRLRWASRLGTLVGIFALVFLVLTAAAQSAEQISERLPFYQDKLWTSFYALEATASEYGIEWLRPAVIYQQFSQLPVAGTVSGFLGSVVTFLGNFLLVMIFTGFLVFGSDRVMGGQQDIAERVTAYLSVKVAMSLLTGVMVVGLCLLFGVDFALFWGTLAFLLNFIPSVGAIAASLPPVLVAFIQLQSPASAFLFAGLLGVMHIGIGQILEPKFMGDRLAINPVAILLGLIFWGFLWGIPGMFLAAPLMALLRIYFSHYNFGRTLEQLLAAE